MPVYLTSRLAITPAFSLIEDRGATTVGIDCALQHLAPLRGTLSPARMHEEPEHDRNGNDRDYRGFGDIHDRLLILVIDGRSGTIARRIAAACDLAHTRAHKFGDLLLAGEQRNRSVGFSLR